MQLDVKKLSLIANSRAFYLNELVIHEIRNNASAIFQNFLFSCCKNRIRPGGKNPGASAVLWWGRTQGPRNQGGRKDKIPRSLHTARLALVELT